MNAPLESNSVRSKNSSILHIIRGLRPKLRNGSEQLDNKGRGPLNSGVALEIEFVNVIVLKEWIESSYPGGMDAYVRNAPTQCLEDEHLTRVGFMSTYEAEDWFLESGLDPASSVILCSNDEPPEWLQIGLHQGRGAVWKTGCEPGDLVGFEPLGLRFLSELLSQPGWLEQVIASVGAQRVTPLLPPELDPQNPVVACQRGLARVEFEIIGGSGIWWVFLPTGRRQNAAAEMLLTRDLRESFLRAGAPPYVPGG